MPKEKVTDRHSHMLDDELRTEPLLRAVRSAVREGDVVGQADHAHVVEQHRVLGHLVIGAG